MYLFTTVLSLLILLGVIVLIHEFGHFIAARLCGVKVETFSFGFGKRLFGKKIGDTDFRVSLVPLGGYVKMSGEYDYDDNKKGEEHDFISKKRWQKIFIIAMGPIMNLVLAWGILSYINFKGVEIDSYRMEKPVLFYIDKESPAEKAGLRKGDQILNIDGNKIENWEDLELITSANGGESLDIVFLRNNKKLNTILDIKAYGTHNLGYAGLYWHLDPIIEYVQKDSPAQKAGLLKGDKIVEVDGTRVDNFFAMRGMLTKKSSQEVKFKIIRNNQELFFQIKLADYNGRAYLGVFPHFPRTIKRHGFLASCAGGAKEMGKLVKLTLSAFQKLFTGRLSPKTLSGPIEIAKVSGAALKSGYMNFLTLMAFISLQLGIVNLFPVPALDGGQLLIYTVESIFRRDLSQNVKGVLTNLGFLMLACLMVFVIINDILKIFK